jgi:signal transduction histidine kinase/ActR/RegA family two-component response regulator
MRWIRDRVFQIRDGEGNSNRVAGIAEDITERKQMDDQVLRSQRMESIGTLAGGVAHDLNNILAPIVMAAEVMRRETDPEARDYILGIIEESAKRGADIVQQVLTFARGTDGERTILQLRHLVIDLEKMMRETFPRLITIVNKVPRNLRTVTGDATQLHQVLLNLCINARDAMPHGGALTISGRNAELDDNDAARTPDAEPGSYTVVEVTDTGMGIPKDIIGKIFDPFFTTKEVGKGTGLGLSTLIGIVKSHHGFVTVDSQVGKGTTFKVYLPANTADATELGQQQSPSIPVGTAETILIVEDESAIRNITENILKKSGYKVLAASNGAEAVSVYAAHCAEIKVVLTDVMMPMLDGVNLARVIKKMNPSARVIATTGQPPETHREELGDLGVEVILQKPYSANKLLTILHKMIQES